VAFDAAERVKKSCDKEGEVKYLPTLVRPQSKKLNCSLINFFPVTYSQHEAIIPYKSIDHPVVTDAVFSQTGKLALEHWIGIRILGKLLFNVV
jgi:hypothetical protein